ELAVEKYLAAIRLLFADQELEYRRLPCTGRTDNRSEFSRRDGQGNVCQNLDITKRLPDLAQLQPDRRHCTHPEARSQGIAQRCMRTVMPKSSSVSAALTPTAARTRSGRKLFLAFRI